MTIFVRSIVVLFYTGISLTVVKGSFVIECSIKYLYGGINLLIRIYKLINTYNEILLILF